MSGSLQSDLLAWFWANKRDLPWRRTKDPYAIWVSEIMLQQTQVATVIPYWERWMARFPSVESLAVADEQDVLSLWQGLGYYRRARMLQAGAMYVEAQGLPKTVEGWRAVPGIGSYTAGAIASIAQGIATPLVDGNVERVYSRLTADASAAEQLNKLAWTWAQANLDHEHPGDWNQALMELGATVCKPKLPLCPTCPVQRHCRAFETGLVDLLPTPKVRTKTVQLAFDVWIPIFEGKLGLTQIPTGEWWEGMWEFPRVPHHDSGENLELRALLGEGWLESLGSFKHAVTHHRISLHVSKMECETKPLGLTWFDPNELEGLPLPAPQRKCLGQLKPK